MLTEGAFGFRVRRWRSLELRRKVSVLILGGSSPRRALHITPRAYFSEMGFQLLCRSPLLMCSCAASRGTAGKNKQPPGLLLCPCKACLRKENISSPFAESLDC